MSQAAAERSCTRRRFLVTAGAGLAVAARQARAGAVWLAEPARDEFGGLAWLGPSSRVAAAPSRFRAVKIGSRWLLLTPARHPYWMCGVFNVDLSTSGLPGQASLRQCALAKFGNEAVWARQAVLRLRDWGFNCLAEYASEYALPVPLYGRPGNPQRLPFVAMIRPAAFSLQNRWGYAEAPVKDIIAATDPAVYTGWRGATTPDVFDPNFGVYAAGEAAALARRLGHSPFLLGVSCDDADDLFGFGPGPEVPAARTHPHIGWLVLASQPEVAANPALGVHYADPRLHAKYALQQWLRRRYGNIARLNQAWHAHYTCFGSDGGWPLGRGWLDESGRNAWVGRDPERLLAATPTLRADLDGFLFLYAQTYFQALATAVRRSFPDYLLFGPATLNSWNGLTRAPILRAAGAAVDVLQANAASALVLERTVASAGDLPLVTWTGMAANADSDLFAYPDAGSGAPMYPSQAVRGAAYAQALAGEFARATRSGTHPVVGTKFWGFADSWPEKMNWGLVSLRDNAYDGREAVRRPGHDRWGYATGGELRDYGDSLTSIRAANLAVVQRLGRELAAPLAPLRG